MRNDGRDDRRGNYVPGIISSHEIRERGYRVGTPTYCVVEEGYLVVSTRLVGMYILYAILYFDSKNDFP